MPYPDLMVQPMRQELIDINVAELRTPQDVESFFANEGTGMLVFNSVCGCAAGAARPSVALSLQSENKPDHVASVFAGQDTEATEAARARTPQLPPSSPSIVLIANGQPTHYIPRHRIEGRTPQEIAADITACFDDLAANK